MVLEEYRDGASRHLPDHDTRRLIFILCLPLIDGVFATLLVTGAMETFSDVVAISLTVFTGAGTLAVLYSCSRDTEEAIYMVKQAAPYLLLGALIVSLVAPIYEQLFHIQRFRYAAGLALISIAMKLSELRLADKLSVPAILVTGLMLSVKNPGSLQFSFEYVMPALLTSIISLAALYLAARINISGLELDYIRKGSSIVLLLIAMSLYGFSVPSELGLAVFAASFIISYRAK
ncbi:MAG: DUF5794 domain-containing protein [Candidatus Nanohaloarchaea archaeon]